MRFVMAKYETSGSPFYFRYPDTGRAQDFWAVYAGELDFLQTVNEHDIFIRTSTETRTFQVAGGLLTGMDPAMATKTFPVTTQPSAVSNSLTRKLPGLTCDVII